MTKLKSISLKIYTIEATKSPQNMVNTFEKYKDIIETSDYNSTPEDYTLYTRLNSDYAIALSYIQNHKKALSYLNKSLSLLVNDPAIDKKNIKDVKFYKELLLNRGISNYNLHNYKEAKQDFILLKKLYPDNINIKNWFITVQNVTLMRVRNLLSWLGVGLILVGIVLKRKHISEEATLYLAITCFVLMLVFQMILSDRKRKLNNNN